jgi:tetratricopeptide (TPR) repeat protein
LRYCSVWLLPLFAEDFPLAGWEYDAGTSFNGRYFLNVGESYREQDGYAIVAGERCHYWLYDTVTYHDGNADDIYNRYIPHWIEKMGYVIDYDNIEKIDPNTDLATSVRALMRQRGCDVSVIFFSGPVYKYVRIHEWFQRSGVYKTTVYPLVKGELNMAIVEYTRRIKLNPNDADLYYNRGMAYYSKYWDSLGVARVTSTGAYEWVEAPIDREYSEYFLDAASKDFQAAVRIEPNNALYKKQLDGFGR